MANASDKTAYYRIGIDGNVRQFSEEASTSMKELAEKIANANAVIKEMSNANRNLKGSSDEVKNAKEQLSAAIQKEKLAVVGANLELLKQGATYDRVVKEAKAAAQAATLKATADAQAVKEAKAAAAAKEAWLAQEAAAFTKVADAAKKAADAAKIGGKEKGGEGEGKGIGAFIARLILGRENMALFNRGSLAMGAALLVVSAAAYEAAKTIASLTFELSKWIIVTASMQKSEQLTREAFSGSAGNAANLGTQVALLASKVPTSTAALNDLATQLMRTRLSGATVVDAFNAISQASAAAGPEVGKQIEDWITRGQRFGRMSLNPLEMQNTGIMFKDVAKEYAAVQRIGFDQAQKELFLGTAKLSAGATALRIVVERQFANINAQKMLTLDHITETWGKHLRTLTTGVDFTQIARPLGEIMSLFDASTASGKALKSLVEMLGGSIGDVFHGAVQFIQDFVEKSEILILRAILKFYDFRDAVREVTGDKTALSNMDLFSDVLKALGAVAAAASIGMVALAAATVEIWGPIVALVAAGTAAYLALSKLDDWLRSINWSGVGHSMMDGLVKFANTVVDYWSGIGASMMEGLVNGILGMAQRVSDAVVKVASVAKKAFTGAMDMHSPSKVFEGYGKQTTAGYTKGLDESSGSVQRSVDKMAPSAPAASGGSAVAAGGGTQLFVNINVNSGPSGEQIAATLSGPSFLGQLMHEIEHVLQSQGVPTQSLVAP
jgi:hypothetical protein